MLIALYDHVLFFSLDNWFILLIPALIAHSFIPLVELVIPIWVSTNEGNLDIETQPLTAETKTREISN